MRHKVQRMFIFSRVQIAFAFLKIIHTIADCLACLKGRRSLRAKHARESATRRAETKRTKRFEDSDASLRSSITNSPVCRADPEETSSEDEDG